MARSTILITLIFSVNQQISFGQLIAGNNFSSELNKIQASQQQSHKTNTDTTITAEHNGNTRNLQYLSGADLNTPNVNNTKALVNGNTISKIKFVRNPAYNVPTPSPASSMVNNNALAPQSLQGSFRSVFLNANPTIDRFNTTAQTPIKYTDTNAGSLSKSPPLYITFGSPPLASSPTQNSLLANFQPILSSVQFVPNTVKLQTSASPAQKQGSPQTFASFLIPPTNAQNDAKLLYAQTPPAALPTQLLTPAPDNTVQSQHSLTSLLSHLLSQSSNVEDPSTPIMNHDPKRNSMQSSVKVLLPLLLQLLYEKNNDCCECEKYHRYNKCKPDEMNKRFKDNPVEINSKSNTNERFVHAYHVANFDRLQEDTAKEEDYSDEMSDYSDEYYEDD